MTNKTPFLTGFPHQLFGRDRASGQARLSKELARLRENAPGELSGQLADCIPAQVVAAGSETRRRRHFSDEVTFWGFLSQVISEDRSCAHALARIQAWLADHGAPVPSASTGAFCKARARLPMVLVEGVHAHLCGQLAREVSGDDLWCGHVAKALDGSSVQLPDTPENQELYPQPSCQKEGCGFPIMKISGLLNLSHGGWEQWVTSDRFHHDMGHVADIEAYLGPDEVLVADRPYCSYELMARLREKGVWMVVRLHQKRKVDWRRGRKLSGNGDRLFTWKKPVRQSPKSRIGADEWAALPDELPVRLVRASFVGRDGKTKTIVIATTLLDAVKYAPGDIEQLYGDRWQIELRLRDIKTTMGMEALRARTPEMAQKEVAFFAIAYNVVRLLMMKAANRHGGWPQRISFKGTLQVLHSWSGRYRKLHHQPRKSAQLYDEMLEQIAARVVPCRPGRSEPRAVKKRPKPHQLLTAPRGQFQEIQHRSRYRKTTNKLLK